MCDFVTDALSDLESPSTSNFIRHVPEYVQDIHSLVQDADIGVETCNHLLKSSDQLSAALKDMHSAEQNLVVALDQMARMCLEQSKDTDSYSLLGAAYTKFSVLLHGVSALNIGLAQAVNNHLVFPLNLIQRTNIKESRKNVERTARDLEAKYKRLEKEKRGESKERGWARGEIPPYEFSTQLHKERAAFQYQYVNLLTNVNEMNDRSGAAMVQHLVDYFYSLYSYYRDGFDHMQQMKPYVDELVGRLKVIKLEKDTENNNLRDIKHKLNAMHNIQQKSSGQNLNLNVAPQENPHSEYINVAVNRHMMEMQGYLSKKSSNKVWQKRLCRVKDACFLLPHSHGDSEPIRVELISSHVKKDLDDEKSFYLISSNRKYHLCASDANEANKWFTCLMAAKESAQSALFSNGPSGSKVDLYKNYGDIANDVLKYPGNDTCADCGSLNDVTWCSINHGCVLCIKCSGVHREMGVHLSRIQSLTLDKMCGIDLLVPISVGNEMVNCVLESMLTNGQKIQEWTSDSDRKYFIEQKYLHKKLMLKLENSDEILKEGVENCDIKMVMHAIYSQAKLDVVFDQNDTPILSKLIMLDSAHATTLHILQFILMQSDCKPNNRSGDGESALHVCARFDKANHMRALLRHRNIDIHARQCNGKTPIHIAHALESKNCLQLLENMEKSEFDRSSLGNIEMPKVLLQKLNPHTNQDQHDISSSLSTSSAESRTPPKPPPSALKPAHLSINAHKRSDSHGINGTEINDWAKYSGSLPLPAPRKARRNNTRRCRALYNCEADNQDELSFAAGDIIVVKHTNKSNTDDLWIEGCLLNRPEISGFFPVTFVTFDK